MFVCVTCIGRAMSDTQQFVEEALETHNAHRARHGAPPLKLAPRLCKSAQEWAEKLLTMSMLQNSPLANQGEVGENISMRRGSDIVDISGARRPLATRPGPGPCLFHSGLYPAAPVTNGYRW